MVILIVSILFFKDISKQPAAKSRQALQVCVLGLEGGLGRRAKQKIGKVGSSQDA